MKAAAKGYFGKTLEDLTLAQDAILAAIPQSPTKFDLDAQRRARSASRTSPRARSARSSSSSSRRTSEIVQRRNYVLDLMKTRSPLTGDEHTRRRVRGGQGRAGRSSRRRSRPTWRAPHFVWQVRDAARRRSSAPTTPDDCAEGRHRRLPGHDDARLEHAEDRREVGLRRGPRAQRQGPAADPDAAARSRARDWSWILGLRGHNIHNARVGGHRLPDRRGPRLRRQRRATRPRATRSSSPSSTSWPTAGASPGRRSSRSTTPIGIDDETLTAATMFMDVTTNFGGGFTPTQADKLERGPVRLRIGAPVLAQHPGHQGRRSCSGLDHTSSGPRTSA